jgi:hypothetical protein
MAILTALTCSARLPGRLKKNLLRSKTLSVERNLVALESFSSTGKNTWLAFCDASGRERIELSKEE